MTIGEIIKNYTSEHSMKEFTKNSGLSRAYAYMLINNKNNKGVPITPSLDTIQQVANGVGKSFSEVLNLLDQDSIVKVKPKVTRRTQEEEEVISSIRNKLDDTPSRDSITETDRHMLFCYHLLSEEAKDIVDGILQSAYNKHIQRKNEEKSFVS